MQTHRTVVLILLVALIVSGIIIWGGESSPTTNTGKATRSMGETRQERGIATIEDGVQYIDVLARGGYWPRFITAQRDIETIVRMQTVDTYDCSMALVIPDIGYRSFLQPSGVEEIRIPLEQTTGTLRGMCSMAMYHFEIVFE